MDDLLKWCESKQLKTEVSANIITIYDENHKLVIDYVDFNEPAAVERFSAKQSKEDSIVVLFHTEWRERKEQWAAVILHQMGRVHKRIYARDCTVKSLSIHEANQFIDKYHIQGSNSLGIRAVGLFYFDEIVGAMTLGRSPRQQMADNRIVMDRMCFKPGFQVVGGASKMLKECSDWARNAQYDEIVTYSDTRWTDGNTYEQIGFELERKYNSDYFYVKDGQIYTKQSQRKPRDYTGDKTEQDLATEDGKIRVYDFGKRRWVINLNPGEHKLWKDKASEICATQHSSGQFRHAHIRGEFRSQKNDTNVYFGSSYELRCMYLLESNTEVVNYRRCDAFKGDDGWRNPDLFVTFTDGHSEIWEVKPNDFLTDEDVKLQIADSIKYADYNGYGFKVWSEKDSQFEGSGISTKISKWARRHIAETKGDFSFSDREHEVNRRKRQKHYNLRIKTDTVPVECAYCKLTHTVLRISYNANMKRNGTYICEAYGGHLAGSKPKPSLHGHNPYVNQEKKQCTECKQILSIKDHFNSREKSWDKLDNLCRDCRKIRKKADRTRALTKEQAAKKHEHAMEQAQKWLSRSNGSKSSEQG